MTNKTFAERLAWAMERKGITQTELSVTTKIGISSISQYLSGKYEPKQKNIYKLSIALNVSPEYLMGLTEAPMSEGQEVTAANTSKLSRVARQMELDFTEADANIIEQTLSALLAYKKNNRK